MPVGAQVVQTVMLMLMNLIWALPGRFCDNTFTAQPSNQARPGTVRRTEPDVLPLSYTTLDRERRWLRFEP